MDDRKQVTEADSKESKLLERPTRPLSAYNLFFRDERAKLIESLPSKREPTEQGRKRKCHHKIGFADLATTIANRWKTIDDSTKHKYEIIASAGREDYKKRMAKWKRQQESLGLPTKKPKAKHPKPNKKTVHQGYAGPVSMGNGVYRNTLPFAKSYAPRDSMVPQYLRTLETRLIQRGYSENLFADERYRHGEIPQDFNTDMGPGLNQTSYGEVSAPNTMGLDRHSYRRPSYNMIDQNSMHFQNTNQGSGTDEIIKPIHPIRCEPGYFQDPITTSTHHNALVNTTRAPTTHAYSHSAEHDIDPLPLDNTFPEAERAYSSRMVSQVSIGSYGDPQEQGIHQYNVPMQEERDEYRGNEFSSFW